MLLVLAIAGCVPRPVAPSHAPAAVQGAGAACLARLDQDALGYHSVPGPDAPHPCGVDTAVTVTKAGAGLEPPALMGCALAEILWRWETEAVEPAARRILHGEVRTLLNQGAYACRQEIGSHRNYVSQHAYGMAIDVAGWELTDGRRVEVGKDWGAATEAGRFLHAAAASGCRYFSVVLTPSVNAAHRTHLHLDIGPYRDCRVR